MLNLNRLRIFVEVSSAGSFSAAADSLSYTQSAVSQQIAALEAETGVSLIERLPRGDLLRHRGLRVGERIGRSGERSALGDLDQNPQPVQVKH